jgi:hypothetical protein
MFSPTWVFPADVTNEIPPGCTLIGLVPLKSGSLLNNAKTRADIDSLISKMATVDKDSFIRIEGHSGVGTSRDDYITKSFYLAKEVERYLRLERDVKHDLYLAAIEDKTPPRKVQFVRIVVYPNKYKERAGTTQLFQK